MEGEGLCKVDVLSHAAYADSLTCVLACSCFVRVQEGSVYKGEFVEGKMHGFGTLYGVDGAITFQVCT